MWRWLAVAVVVVGCAKKPERNVPADIRVAEQDVGHRLEGIVIAASGVYIDDVRVPDVPAALEKLPDPVDVWLIAEREPAWKTTLALRTIAAKRKVRLRRAERGHEDICPNGTLHLGGRLDEEAVSLGVLIVPDRIWLGISRINEFQDIPLASNRHDYATLRALLNQHKQSAFFVDRTDIEIGAEKGVPSETIAHAIEVACAAGFVDVAILSPDLLSVVPAL